MSGAPAGLAGFDHLVVLMLENHSFDHLLGFLYEGDAPRRFLGRGEPVYRGAAGLALSNRDGGDPPREVFFEKAPWEGAEDMCQPCPDPGEFYLPHVNRQLYGVDDVRTLAALPDPAPMSGFLADYARTIRESSLRHHEPPLAQTRRILQGYPPQALPVLSDLAREFAVCDEWFASVPSQTFCNRSFLHSGQSHGWVRNADYVKWPSHNHAPTIFEALAKRLGEHDAWRVYWDPQDMLCLTRVIHPNLDRAEHDGRFRPFERFAEDCARGHLPAYSFLQPRLIVNHNDMHPPVPLNPFVHSSVLAGELLVNEVYDAVRTGAAWERTLLVLLFDEHGGCYDHWPPPRGAVPPGARPPQQNEDGFGFDRFGVRVPAIFVSPFVEPGSVVRARGETPFDHTSVIRTLCARFGLDGLTARDRAAPDFGHVLQRPLGEPRRETPAMHPRPYAAPSDEAAKHGLLSRFQRDVLGLFHHEAGAALHESMRVSEALERLAARLRGRH